MKFSDLIPDKCLYCNKEFVNYDIHLRICKRYKGGKELDNFNKKLNEDDKK